MEWVITVVPTSYSWVITSDYFKMTEFTMLICVSVARKDLALAPNSTLFVMTRLDILKLLLARTPTPRVPPT